LSGGIEPLTVYTININKIMSEKIRVLILGSGGMLGWAVSKVFAGDDRIEAAGTVRNDSRSEYLAKIIPGMKLHRLDAEHATIGELAVLIDGYNWVVNCIGVIKPFIHDDNPAETERALRINSMFPHNLARAAATVNSKVLQIATDCVYSGAKGNYTEGAKQDALDVYGKTKSLGEAFLDNIFHLRCSIIGLELGTKFSLMEWFLGQPENGSVNGFTNHDWNGITTYHYGLLCKAIIASEVNLPHVQHIVPGNKNTKYEMLGLFAENFRRNDIIINPMEAKDVIDRTLGTDNPEMNRLLWQEAGYEKPPTIAQMIAEYVSFAKNAALL